MTDKLQKEIEEVEKNKAELIEIRKHLMKESQELNQLKNMANNSTAYGFMEPYNAETEEWSHWTERLEQYFDLNNIKEEKQVAMLLTMVGSKGYALFRNLCLPDLPKTKTFEELKEKMQNHIQPPPSEIAERYKFKQCMQREGEDIKTFCARMKGLSTHCNFGTELSKHLRDQFVCGTRSSSTKEKLLRSGKDLTFDKAVEIASAMETAHRDSTSMNQLLQESSSMNVIKERKAHHKASGKKQTDSSDSNYDSCKHCGKNNHISSRCRYKNYKCNNCGLKGHLASICRRKKENSFNENKKGNKYNKDKNVEKQNYIEKEIFDKSFNFEDDLNYFDSTGDDKVFVTVKIDKKPVKFEIDSGSPITAISSEFYEENFKANYELKETNRKFKSYINQSMIPLGVFDVNVTYKHKSNMLDVMVMPNGSNPIMGRKWLRILGILNDKTSVGNNTLLINKIDEKVLFEKYACVFTEKLGKYKLKKMPIFLKPDTKPVFKKAIPVPYAIKPKVDAEIDRLLKEGVIVPVQSSEWATPIVIAHKKNGQIRICGNYKITVNPHINIDRHPIPRVQDMHAKMQGCSFQTKLDFSQAYHQIELDQKAREILTINTHRGLFQYIRAPFGPASVPGWFQREMDQLLGNMEGVTVYFDDVRVSGMTQAEHDERLLTVLEKLKFAGITVSKEKAEICKPSIKFLGTEINADGFRASKDKVEAITNIARPRNKKELQSFLGMMNYHSKFIKNYADIVKPLYELLKKSTDFTWSKNCENAFTTAKERLKSREVLMFYSTHLPVKLTCDASPTGLGAVIAHVLPDKTEKPIAYASRILTPAEKNYSQLDREALSIVYAVKYFHQYLFGREFELLTDHKPLIYIFGDRKGIPQMSASRVQRWAIILMNYNFKIKHIPGKNNCTADCLSRLINAKKYKESDNFNDSDYNHLNFISQNVNVILATEVEKETNQDMVLKVVKNFIINGWPNQVSDDIKIYKQRKHELNIENGCIMWGHRLVIPSSLRENLLKELHQAHTGIVRMKMLARSYIWWPKIDQEIESITKKCELCLENAPNPPKSHLHVWEWPEKPNERIHIDFLGPIENKMYVAIIDAHSKWADIREMSKITAEATIEIVKDYICTWGLPLLIVSDNGPAFIADAFKKF